MPFEMLRQASPQRWKAENVIDAAIVANPSPS